MLQSEMYCDLCGSVIMKRVSHPNGTYCSLDCCALDSKSLEDFDLDDANETEEELEALDV